MTTTGFSGEASDMTEEPTTVDPGRTERPMVTLDGPVADLSSFTKPEELAHIGRINAGCIVVPEALAAAAAQIPSDAGAVVTVPAGVHARVMVGMTSLSGDGLAPDDGQDYALVVVGCLVITSPVVAITYQQLSVIGMVLSPRSSAAVLGPRFGTVIGTAEYYDYAPGQSVSTQSGEVTLSRSMLANAGGGRDDLLLIAGQALIDEPVTELGFRRIIVAGQIFAPKESRDLLGPAMQVAGQVLWYDATTPRVIRGDERYGAAFLELLDTPAALIVTGTLVIEDDVSPELLRAKISGITLTGSIRAPKAVLPVIQLLASENFGDIRATEDAGT